MKGNPKKTKAKKPTKKQTVTKEEQDKTNEHGGIPDMDFKKLIGCG